METDFFYKQLGFTASNRRIAVVSGYTQRCVELRLVYLHVKQGS